MRHLARLAAPELLDLGELDVRALPHDCTVLFFTEYSIIESAIGQSSANFPGLQGLPKDTPDLVILVTAPHPVLIALEAKMYDRPSRPDLLKQLAAQTTQLEAVADALARLLDVPAVEIAHAALLPSKLADSVGPLPVRVITWEQILETYSDVNQAYFLAILRTALDRYDHLVSKWAGYQQGDLAGANLVMRSLAGDETWPWMGIQGGLKGQRLAHAVSDGSWGTRVFQCRHDPLPNNPNWFPVTDFIGKLRDAGEDVQSLGPTPADEG
ncbi:hypothetical protein [Nocardioides sp. CFH 31398]|uniref:hypothetical protein n=1 Tax=Nocardioides sp. CFH 31398 TaxID=2919579 RepID=UPI001F0608CF|nr:hypothetical protein [Nocardioides sp. CFH 31398]MCH1867421.1 hypothetical protein [Nocardioides sp. CFH 31398]